MIHFTPTLGIKDTAKNANGFIKENMDTFWAVFKPLAPYIIVLSILDLIITEFFMPTNDKTGEPYDFPLGSLIAGYFYTCLAITWHRVVIHGGDKYEPMNPFNPKKSELAFIGMGIALFVVYILTCAVGGAIIGLTGLPILFALILPIVGLALYAWMKFMFYFPAKATGRHISLKESFKMTKGYIWKMIASSFLAYLKLFFITLAYLIVGFILIGGLGFLIGALGIDPGIPGLILGTLFMIPIIAFFQPLFAVIWVTVLSNYYQYVMQNDAPPIKDTKPTND